MGRATLLSHTQNVPPAKWSGLTNIPDILMLRLHVATPLPCPRRVTRVGLAGCCTLATTKRADGRKRPRGWLKRHADPTRHLSASHSLTAASLAAFFTPNQIKYCKTKIHKLVRSHELPRYTHDQKQWLNISSTLSPRQSFQLCVYREKTIPPSVSQSCRKTAWRWRQNLWGAIKCRPTTTSSTDDQTPCWTSTWQ